MLEACQDFFLEFEFDADYVEGRLDLDHHEDCFIGASRIFGVRCVFASLFEKRDSGTAREMNPGTVVCAVPSALGSSAKGQRTLQRLLEGEQIQ